MRLHNGKHEEALRLIGAIRHPTHRARYLVQLAINLAPGRSARRPNILEQVAPYCLPRRRRRMGNRCTH